MDTLETALAVAVSSGESESPEYDDVELAEGSTGTSNAILLTASEQQLVKDEIEKTNGEIDALDEQIARLAAIRRGKSAKLCVLRTAIAPHKNLPLEILSLIFTYTLPTPDPNHCALSIPTCISDRASPWNLRQVCSTWRKAALSNVNLWNSITVTWTNNPSRRRGAASDAKTLAKHLNIAVDLLPRRGPIHLEFSLRDTTAICRNLIQTYMDHFVAPRQHQVKSLRIRASCSHDAFQSLYLGPASIEMPILETLQLVCVAQNEILDDEREDNMSFTDSNFALFKSKRLQSLRFVGGSSSMDNAFSVLQTPWMPETLRKLDLEHQPISAELPAVASTISWAEFCQPLHRCVNLVELTLKLVNPVTPSSTTEHLLLPELKYLALYSATPFVLDSFTLPALKHLKYRSAIDMGIEKLTSLLKRSKCSLTTFVEDGRPKGTHPAPIERAKWVEFLKHLDTVKEFETTTVFRVIDMSRLGSGEILPAVECVDVMARDPSSAFELIEGRIARSGLGAPSKLRRVCINYKHDSRWHESGVFPSFRHAKVTAEGYGSSIEFKAIRTEEVMRSII